ncbi:MAG: transposase, partial [bacterium]
AYYGTEVIAAARRVGAHFSVTARKDRAISAAIATISEETWVPIRYPKAIYDEQLGTWISDAQVAEIPFTAFRSRRKSQQVTARLIVRRVKDANPEHVRVNAQGELFAAWRYHAIFTDSPLPMLHAEADHRRHAIIEQVIADLKSGPLAHLPSGDFMANSAWLALTTIAFNLTRATGALACSVHAKAVTATIRTQLINIAARIATSARRTTLHMPAAWPWAGDWQHMFTAATGPPARS